MNLRSMQAAVFAVAVTLGATQASASVIETFSFETPSLGSGVYYYNPSGTPGVTYNGISGPTGGGGSGIAANGSAFGFPNAPDGNQAAFIQNANNTVGQITLSLSGLTAGASYFATFYTAARPGYPVNPLLVDFDSTLVGSSTGASSSFTLQTTSDFVATSGTDTLTFTGQAIPALGGDVALDFVAIQSIPEPASWAFLIVGITALSAARRDRASLGYRLKRGEQLCLGQNRHLHAFLMPPDDPLQNRPGEQTGQAAQARSKLPGPQLQGSRPLN